MAAFREAIRMNNVCQRPRRTPGNLKKQGCRSLDGSRLSLRVHAPLIPKGGVCMEAISPSPPRDDLLWPERRLQENIAGLAGHRRGEPTHDARESYGTGIVAYNHRVGSEFDFPLIEQREPLTRGRKPRPDGSGKPVQVVRMQWLTEFEHHVVRHVHHGMNRANATAAEAFGHPQRRPGCAIDVPDNATGEAGTGSRVLERHRVLCIGRRLHGSYG